jgi:hypothetical protein
MKALLRPILLFTVLLATSFGYAQEKNKITEADWNKIIPHLVNEEWADAEKISLQYLNRFKGDDVMSDEAGIVRYMYLKCVSALLGDKAIDKEQAMKKLKGFEGKNVITPFNSFKVKGMFNYLKMAEDGKAWWKCSANNEATVIHAFETYQMSDKTTIEKPEQYEGKEIRLSAIIKEITAGGTVMPRLNILFTATEIWDIK